ncbi:MAG TPA: hypothetical protein PKH58_13475, partial [Paludibacteraceae bacterium]|nr:hypothetical protein [Paludibacteraceae bacterium]
RKSDYRALSGRRVIQIYNDVALIVEKFFQRGNMDAETRISGCRRLSEGWVFDNNQALAADQKKWN